MTPFFNLLLCDEILLCVNFKNDDLEQDLSDGEMEILMDIDAIDEIPSAQVPPTLPTTTPPSQSSSSTTPIDANTNASSSSTVNNVNANSNTFNAN